MRDDSPDPSTDAVLPHIRQGEEMAIFTGAYSGVFDTDAGNVFRVATLPMNLERWCTTQFDNVKPIGNPRFQDGSRFSADESLAEGPSEQGHLYEVFRYEPPVVFAIRCIQGPPYVGELVLETVDARTRISWSCSGGPTGLAERIFSSLLRSRVVSDANKQAEREVKRLVALAAA